MILLSLCAALVFAVGAVLQQHAAAAQPIEHNLRPILILKHIQRPLWLAGIGAGTLGSGLQLLALWRGSLVTVQPLLVCGLLFALPINAIWMHRRKPGAREVLAAGAVCVGLAVFLLATDPRPGRGTGTPEGWAIALSAVLVAAVVLIGCSLASKERTWRAGLLAAAAGLINGLSAAFIKGVARGMAASWHLGLSMMITHALGNWELYAFVVATLLVMLLVQSAYQSGPIRWSLPALTAANPIASVLLGSWLLGENVRSTPLALVGGAGGLVVVVAGIMTLSSSSLITGGLEASQGESGNSGNSGGAGAPTGVGAPAGGAAVRVLEVAELEVKVVAPPAASGAVPPVTAAPAAAASTG